MFIFANALTRIILSAANASNVPKATPAGPMSRRSKRLNRMLRINSTEVAYNIIFDLPSAFSTVCGNNNLGIMSNK
jgi:hypothetical protein